ncbi:MAG: aldo/keto reductase, partial [Proteobacteria bacterium]|nr:aldo/keto reductase [Pseudomonadota bacterium]
MTKQVLPKLALGAWAWGNDGTFGDLLTANELRPVFDAAMEVGLTLWDNAYVYGMGASERVMGNFLRTVSRDSYKISAKFTPQCANPNAENAVIEMYQKSAALLGTDYMDFYWIHNPVGAPRWIKELIPLAKSGKIGNIGVSNHNLAEIKQAQEILKSEGLKISAVQNHYSLINRSSEKSGILDYCKDNDIIFFSYMVL